MKTFSNLMEEVLTPRRCHRCGGCVAFCTAINFGALEMGEDGRPRYKDSDKCIECGLCYEICPAIDALREETKNRISWTPPMGRIMETTVARARDPELWTYARDGGVVTAILLHLLDIGRIDAAIVNKVAAPFTCRPWVATTRQEIIEGGGIHFDASPGVSLFGEQYAAYPPYLQLIMPLARKGMRRIAFVGRPCQIETMRRMETLGVVPSEVIKYYFGLFCMGNFRFGETEQAGGGASDDRSRFVDRHVAEELVEDLARVRPSALGMGIVVAPQEALDAGDVAVAYSERVVLEGDVHLTADVFGWQELEPWLLPGPM